MSLREAQKEFAPFIGARIEALAAGATLLRGFASADTTALMKALEQVLTVAPFRHMVTPGGFVMSVAITNCGALGWTTDARGYRYTTDDPQSGRPWPDMPDAFSRLARQAAETAGFDGFAPDACLINRYEPGARLSLHQDKDERDHSAPIVSVSLGMDATFLFGGHQRSDRPARFPLRHGDVVVWGAEDRLRYHGVLPLKDQPHPELGSQRINLTFRKAG